jgi:hypothetical protein
MKNLELDTRKINHENEDASTSLPVFYLKINLNTDFSIECFKHWTNIVEAAGADYYIVCDKAELKERVINDKNKDKFMPTSLEAKQILRNIVVPFWLNAGAALLTPFLHAKEKGYKTFWNIDADDTVMCADALKCARILKEVQEYADKTDIDCFSLDMHSSGFERFYPHWTFGVCYCKTSTDYISKLMGFNEFFASINLKRDELFDNNLDEVFSILGEYSQIKTGIYYVENMYFRHCDFEIHCYKDRRFIYRDCSQFTKVLWRLKNSEIENGLPIPERFVKFDIGLTQEESLAFLEGNPIFNDFEGRTYHNFNFDYVAKKLKAKNKKLVLFGAGKDGLRSLIALRALFEIEPYAFCDNSPRLAGTEVHGVRVISFEQLKKLSAEEEVYVLITTSAFYNEIRKQLASVDVEILNQFSDVSLCFRESFAKTFKLFDDNKFTPIYLWGDYNWFKYFNDFYKFVTNYDLLNDIEGFIETELPPELKSAYNSIPLDELPEDAFVIISTESGAFNERQRELLRRGKINNYNFILGFELEHAYKRIIYSVTRKFQNYYKGARCFILGNGPSLSLEDLETLRENNEIIFASNNFYKWFDKTKLRPDFYFISDVLDVRVEDFIAVDNINFIVNIGFRNDVLKKAKKVFYFETSPWVQYSYYPYKPFFSEDLPLTYEAGSICYIMLQMAVNMGFKEIYFLGMDNAFPVVVKHDGTVIIDEKIQHHFYGDHKLRLATYNKDMFEAEYKYAREYCERKGVSIFNATRGGKLEVFERVDFDSLFPKEDAL